MAKTNAPENFIDIYETPQVIDASSVSGDQPVAQNADNSLDKASDKNQADLTEVPAQTADFGDKTADTAVEDSAPAGQTVVANDGATAEPITSEGAPA